MAGLLNMVPKRPQAKAMREIGVFLFMLRICSSTIDSQVQ